MGARGLSLATVDASRTSSVSFSTIYDTRDNRMFSPDGWFHALQGIRRRAFFSENQFTKFLPVAFHQALGPCFSILRLLGGWVFSRQPQAFHRLNGGLPRALMCGPTTLRR